MLMKMFNQNEACATDTNIDAAASSAAAVDDGS